MTTSPALKAKIEQGVSDLAKAQQEVSVLLQELNAGTLNPQTLRAGLVLLQQYVSQVSYHIPTFSDDVVGGK
jgi:hypothetical protein